MTKFETTLESFLQSSDFEQGVISSTKASWGGSDYRVELMPDSTWSVLWKNQIGNKYETPGIILVLPTVDDSEVQKYQEATGDSLDNVLHEQFIVEEEELKDELRNALQDKLVMMEM